MTKKELVLQNILAMKDNNNGKISDGDHTFDDLYEHRETLCALICSFVPQICFKAVKHYDGSSYEGYFIMGFMTPDGLATYHYHMDNWNDFPSVPEFPCAPDFDGHTPKDVLQRLHVLGQKYQESTNKALFLEKLSRKLEKEKEKCIAHMVLNQ